MNEYITRRLGILELQDELKRLIGRYHQQTGRNLFVYAADFNKGRRGIDVALMQDDFYTIQDILRESDKKQIDVYLETPGGSGEAAEEIAKFLRKKFDEVNFVIAGEAKSAGTILALSGDNIYMCETGSLGPIDAQIKIGRFVVSAHDYKAWVDEKRNEATNSGCLNPFDAIMVAQISPGEIYGVVNSLEFAKDLVKNWLEKYKFKHWTHTASTHKEVTPEMRKQRAEDVAEKLCDHMSWRTHGRSLKIEDLQDVLFIENIDQHPQLSEIVYRIKTVIRLIFDSSTNYKLYFWEDFQITRTAAIANANMPTPMPVPNKSSSIEQAILNINCPKCGKKHDVPGYFDISSDKIKQLKLPTNNNVQDNDVIICDNANCNFTIDLKPIKNQIETQSKRKITFK
ncbi:MAG: ATP-dependent Clp protease proteolytic subunit [Bacteroidales bacterium]|nr:ATP-dependent Clp protease proteolytic subunit [Bacteroidales bacterium]